MVNDAMATTDSPQRPRFRFGLKSLFVVMTILCAWLGYRAVRHYQFEQIRSRHIALVKAIHANLDEIPANTSRATVQRDSRPWSGSMEFHKFLIRNAVTMAASLTIGPALAVESDKDIARKLLTHYGRGLADLGLQSVDLSTQTEPETQRVVWQSPDYGIVLVIDARVLGTADAKQADITFLLIHNEDAWP